MKITDKRVLLTGATGGIGSAIAKKMADAGARLILCGRSYDALSNLKSELTHSAQHEILCFDLSETSAVISQYMHKYGPIDILINNAGLSVFSWLEDQSEESIAQQININLITPILLTRLVVPHLSKCGMIVNIGSCFGAIGYPGYSVYCASKFGLRGFSESIARELAQENIRVIYIAPRATATPFNNHIVNALNESLNNAIDSPERVANYVVRAITKEKDVSAIGFPEKIFVYLNAVFPTLVSSALLKKTDIIKHFAKMNKE